MKEIMAKLGVLAVANLAAVVCFGGAIAILLTGGTEGWGWLIVAGLLVSAT